MPNDLGEIRLQGTQGIANRFNEDASTVFFALFFGGFGYPGLIDEASLAGSAAAKNIADTDITDEIAFHMVTDALKAALAKRLSVAAQNGLDQSNLTAEAVIGAVFPIFFSAPPRGDFPIKAREICEMLNGDARMPASADAIKELSVKAVEGAYGHQAALAYEWFCFGGPFWPGMVDAGKLLSGANGTNDQVAAAVNDVTGGLALKLVNFAAQQSAEALLGTEAKLVIGALGYTAADLVTAGLFIFSPTDIGQDAKPGPQSNQSSPPGQFQNPFGISKSIR